MLQYKVQSSKLTCRTIQFLKHTVQLTAIRTINDVSCIKHSSRIQK